MAFHSLTFPNVTRSGLEVKNWSTEKHIKEYLLEWNSNRIRAPSQVAKQAQVDSTRIEQPLGIEKFYFCKL